MAELHIKGRPFKLHNEAERRTIGIIAKSLAEVKENALAKFGLTPESCRIFLEDLTEVENEEYFRCLPDHTKLIVVGDRGEWMTGIWAGGWGGGQP